VELGHARILLAQLLNRCEPLSYGTAKVSKLVAKYVYRCRS